MKEVLKGIIILSCILFFSCGRQQKSEKLVLTWKKSDNQSINGVSEFSENIDSDKVKLTDTIQINKTTIDSLIDNTNFSKDNQNYSVSNFGFNCEKTHTSLDFNSNEINVYRISWINEAFGFMEYSNLFLYTKEYGVIYRTYSGSYKVYVAHRLLKYKEGDYSAINFTDFTKEVLAKYKMQNWEESSK